MTKMPRHKLPQETGAKRDKYTSHACCECQRRKVKCSGQPLCSNCRIRGVNCQYEDVGPRGPKPRKRFHENFSSGDFHSNSFSGLQKRRKPRSTLKDQLAQLQEKVDELIQGQNSERLDISSSPELLHDMSLSSSPQILKDSAKSNPGPESPFNWSIYTSPLDSSNHGILFQDTDVFHAQGPVTNPIAMSFQIDTLRKLGCRNHFQQEPLPKMDYPTEPDFVAQFPEPTTLWAQVAVFLAEFGCYFPCLHEDKVCDQLSTALASLGYNENNTEVYVNRSQCQIIAFLFNILAYAEAVTQSISTGGNINPHPGAERYFQGARLMGHFGKLHGNDLQTTVYHTTATAYLLELGMLQMAFQSISSALQTALCINLNNQSRWPNMTKGEDIACRQSLWWTIFFLDKRVAQKIGIAYSIRQSECAVREYFEDDSSISPQAHHELLQSMISFGQLWAQIWDNLFSSRSNVIEKKEEKDDAWAELQLTDMKIIMTYRRLSSRLRWKSEKMRIYIENGDSEKEVRRRLLVFLRFALLRLSIRHVHLKDAEADFERRKCCVYICLATVKAIQTYTETFGYHKPSGHVLTSAIIEILYYIVCEQQRQGEKLSDNDHGGDEVVSQETLERAKICCSTLLHKLALTTPVASRACEALQEVLSPTNFNFDDQSHDHETLLPGIVEGDFNVHCMQQDDAALGAGLWRTTSEAAGQEYDPESPKVQTPSTSKINFNSPSLGECVGVRDAFGNLVGDVDWESLLRALPLE